MRFQYACVTDNKQNFATQVEELNYIRSNEKPKVNGVR